MSSYTEIDYKDVYKRFLLFKYWYIGLGVFLLSIAYIINKYHTRKYENSAIILLKENDGASLLNIETNFSQITDFFQLLTVIDNEKKLIKTFDFVKGVFNQLDVDVSYYSINNKFIDKSLNSFGLPVYQSLYDKSPIKVTLDKSKDQLVSNKFFIKIIDNDKYILTVKPEKSNGMYNFINDKYTNKLAKDYYYEKRHEFGKKVQTKYFSFTVNKIKDIGKEFTQNSIFYFVINDINKLTYKYINNLSIEQISENSTLLNLSIKGENKNEITAFLNALTHMYINRDVEKRNKHNLKVLRFINTELDNVTESLKSAKENLQQFRKTNAVVNLSYQGQEYFDKLDMLENQKASYKVQKKYYGYLLNYLNDNTDIKSLVSPSSKGFTDPVLEDLLSKLIGYSTELSNTTTNDKAEKNLFVNDMKVQINTLKQTIAEHIKNSINQLEIAITEIEKRIEKNVRIISKLPAKQLQLLANERTYNINDSIYTLLLMRRSKTKIAYNATFSSYEIIEPAKKLLAHKHSPDTKLNYAIAFIFALIIPTAFVLMIDFFDNTVSERDNIPEIVKLPLLGSIYHNSSGSNKIFFTEPQSMLADSFRSVRTNYSFLSKQEETNVIVLSSSMSNEGKTYNSINLALCFAANGHKTILLEFDLRRPKIHQEFGLNNEAGITSYFIKSLLLDDIIKPTTFENLDLINSGPPHPNPSVLIDSQKTVELIASLRDRYEYIIMDTAPVGIISDTINLMKLSDTNIIVLRNKKTIKEQFFQTIKKIQDFNITNVVLLENDVSIKKGKKIYYKYYS